jgi:hypothetical protein
MTTQAYCNAHFGPDFEAARAYWSEREYKKFAVHVWTGPDNRPTTERVIYVGARRAEDAVLGARHNTPFTFPAGAKFAARLAGPHELGCSRTST